MSRHRSQGGDCNYPEFAVAVGHTARRPASSHRISSPSPAVRGRVMVAAVAVGAFAAATAGQVFHMGAPTSTDGVQPLADTQGASAMMGMGGESRNELVLDRDGANMEIMPISRSADSSSEAAKLAASVQLLKLHEEAVEAAKGPQYIRPAQGVFTSGYGGRWGAMHYGVDIANRIGTPIYAVTDGKIISAGPASGFGLWVRILHPDGTISVYGHVNDYVVDIGQEVKAGQLIAHIGNRGESTGPHLHFEIWDASGRKMNPQPWLAEHGISL